jgi:hypothetical protein
MGPSAEVGHDKLLNPLDSDNPSTGTSRFAPMVLPFCAPAEYHRVGNGRRVGLAAESGMPLFKYFVTVGALLTVGLFALSAYLDPGSSDAAARVSITPTTASLVSIAPAQPRSK